MTNMAQSNGAVIAATIIPIREISDFGNFEYASDKIDDILNDNKL